MPERPTSDDQAALRKRALVELDILNTNGGMLCLEKALLREMETGIILALPSSMGCFLPTEQPPALFRVMEACGFMAGLRVATWSLSRRKQFIEAMEASPGFHPNIAGMRYFSSRLDRPGFEQTALFEEIEGKHPPVAASGLMEAVAFQHIQRGVCTGLSRVCEIPHLPGGIAEGIHRIRMTLTNDPLMGVMGSGIFEATLAALRPALANLVQTALANIPKEDDDDRLTDPAAVESTVGHYAHSAC